MNDSTSPLKGFITTAQAAEQFGISQPQLANLCRLGKSAGGLHCIKLAPRLWMVEVASLKAYNTALDTKRSTGHLRGRPRKTKPTA